MARPVAETQGLRLLHSSVRKAVMVTVNTEARSFYGLFHFILQQIFEVDAIISCLSYRWGKRTLGKSHCQLTRGPGPQSLLPKSIRLSELLSTNQSVKKPWVSKHTSQPATSHSLHSDLPGPATSLVQLPLLLAWTVFHRWLLSGFPSVTCLYIVHPQRKAQVIF